MIPLGYMLKKVASPPEWLTKTFGEKPCPIEDVYSLSHCISPNFADYIAYETYNGWWLFDEPGLVHDIAMEERVDPASLTLFYYEACETEYDDETNAWSRIAREPSITTAVIVPASKVLCGYDVVTFAMKTAPECSPLSCCGLAGSAPVNRYCLLDDLEDARAFAQTLTSSNSEPGPYRIIAVYRPQDVQ